MSDCLFKLPWVKFKSSASEDGAKPHVSRYSNRKKPVAASVLLVMLLAGMVLGAVNFPTLASATLASAPSPFPNLFPSTVYRTSEHVHSVEESTVSNHYYSQFVNGYDTLYFTYQSNYLAGTPIDDPSFEINNVFASPSWGEDRSQINAAIGYPIGEISTNQHFDGVNSLHLASKSTGSSWSYEGAYAVSAHKTAISSGVTYSLKIYPVQLSDVTGAADSEIQIRFKLLYFDSSTVYPNVVYVYRDDPSESIGFGNSTSTVYYIRNNLALNQWNTFSENVTNDALSYFGSSFANDQAIDKFQIRVYSRNGGTADAYFDSALKQTSKTNANVYTQQEQQLASWSTPSFKLVPGMELTGVSNIFSLNVPSSKFMTSAPGPSGPALDIEALHLTGLYAGLAHPFQTDTQKQQALNSDYNVEMVDVWGNRISDTMYITDTDVWDNYLGKGIPAVATATPNVHAVSGVTRMNTNGFAIYVYSNSADQNEILEKMAMGKSFVEAVSVGGGSQNTVPMKLYFATMSDLVPMGRYPVILDNGMSGTVTLDAVIKDVPASSSYTLVLKKNGGVTVGSPIAITAGASQFTQQYVLPLDNPVPGLFSYYRYEVQDTANGNKPVAFSQPILFTKTSSSVFPGFWTALVPQSSAALDLPQSSVSFSNGILTEQVKARLPQGVGKVATVKTFIPPLMFLNDDIVVTTDSSDQNSWNWNFNPITRMLTVNATIADTTPVTISIRHSATQANQPPTANAGQDQSVFENQLVTLDGSASSDTDGTVASYQWTQTGGSPTVTLDKSDPVHPKFTAPVVASSGTSLTFRLIVTDNQGATSNPSFVNVIVNKPLGYQYAPYVTLSGSNKTDVADSPSLRLSQFSVAAWFKTTTDFTSSNNEIANKGGTGSETAGKNMNYGIWMTNTEKLQAGFETTSGADNFVTSTKKYNDGLWHYAVVTNNGNQVALYVDGQSIGSLSTSSVPDNTGTLPFRVGANSRALDSYFTGTVDEVRVWNRALSQSEITAQYNTGTFDQTGQQIYLDFAPNQSPTANAGPDQQVTSGQQVTLDGSASQDADGTITAYQWTQVGGPTVTLDNTDPVHPKFTAPAVSVSTPLTFQLVVTDNKQATSAADSVVITVLPAYHYDPSKTLGGTSADIVDVADQPSYRLSQFSVAAWFKTTTDFTSSYNQIANKGGTGSETPGKNMNYGIWMTSGEKLQAGFETSPGADNFVTSTKKYNDGLWHYAVVTYDGSQLVLYVDGASVGTLATGGAQPDNTGTQPFRVGGNSRALDSFFTGNIDEVRVWNGALSAQDVASAYTSGVFNPNGQVIYLNFS